MLNQNEQLIALLRNIEVVALATLSFGIILWVADRSVGKRRFVTINFSDAALIGLAQILALIPGTSRAGITIAAARFCGLNRRAATRFSMILSIPVIIGAASLKSGEVIASGAAEQLGTMLIAGTIAMIVALLSIKAMMAIIHSLGFMSFIIYRVMFGGALTVWAFWP